MSDEHGNRNDFSDEDWAVTPVNVQPERNFAKPPQSSPETQTGSDGDEAITLVPSKKVEKKEKPDQWKMPEPVFRVSDGKSHKKSVKETPPTDLPFSEPIKLEKPSPAAAAKAPIQPQPNISAEFNLKDVAPNAPVKTKAKKSNLVFIILILMAIIVFAVVFSVAIYFLFFNKPDV